MYFSERTSEGTPVKVFVWFVSAFAPPIHNGTHSTQQTAQHTSRLHTNTIHPHEQLHTDTHYTTHCTDATTARHHTHRTHSHTHTLPSCSVVFMMIHDKLLIALATSLEKALCRPISDALFCTCPLAVVHFSPVITMKVSVSHDFKSTPLMALTTGTTI